MTLFLDAVGERDAFLHPVDHIYTQKLDPKVHQFCTLTQISIYIYQPFVIQYQ